MRIYFWHGFSRRSEIRNWEITWKNGGRIGKGLLHQATRDRHCCRPHISDELREQCRFGLSWFQYSVLHSALSLINNLLPSPPIHAINIAPFAFGHSTFTCSLLYYYTPNLFNHGLNIFISRCLDNTSKFRKTMTTANPFKHLRLPCIKFYINDIHLCNTPSLSFFISYTSPVYFVSLSLLRFCFV